MGYHLGQDKVDKLNLSATFRVLGRALRTLLTNPLVLARLFWPTFVIMAGGLALDPIAEAFGETIKTVVALLLLGLLFLATSRGLVGWHRWCVLGESPRLAANLDGRDLRYWLTWLWVGFCFALMHVPIFLVLAVYGPIASPSTLLGTFGLQLVALFLGSLIISIPFAYLCRVSALHLVAIAVEADNDEASYARLERLVEEGQWYWQPIALVVFLLLVAESVPLTIPGGEIGSVTLSWLFPLLGFISFATVLSVIYRDYIQKDQK